jgi:Fuc2NAc and GlcNAc transferase
VTPALVLSACAASFVVAVVGCAVARRLATRKALLDIPNERSLHTKPVPRLGGAAILLGTLAVSAAVLPGAGPPVAADVCAWLVASLALAALGLYDDLRSLGAGLRFAVQILVAGAFVGFLGVPDRVVMLATSAVVLPSALLAPMLVVWIVAVLNIYNFMDGMDGLAGAQAVGAGMALAVGCTAHGHGDLAFLAAVAAAAAAGFLVHNAPPAKIFMGDAGSTFLGFGFAALAVMGARRADPVPFVAVPVALAPFLLDGTFTILRRLLRGERIWRAHRTHLYQRAVATGLGHHEVLVPYTVWIAVASAAGAMAAVGRLAHGLAASAVSLAGLGATWVWVARRERLAHAPQPAASSR